MEQESGTTAHLSDVYFSDMDSGIVVGYDGTLLSTSDGGATWTAEWSGTREHFMNVLITQDGTALAVGGQGTILRLSAGAP
jgi:photosystem II stability/assembly factor-like uncharacterized protein